MREGEKNWEHKTFFLNYIVVVLWGSKEKMRDR